MIMICGQMPPGLLYQPLRSKGIAIYRRIMVLFAGLQRYSIIQANLERSKAENGRDKTDKKLVNTGELNLIFHSSLVKRLLDGSFIVYLFDKLYNRLPPTLQCQIYLLKNNLIKEAKIFTHLTNAEKSPYINLLGS